MVMKMLPELHDGSILGNALNYIRKQYLDGRINTFVRTGTQSLYRDNDAQTIPWEAPYTIKPGHNPEVLTILDFIWENGLPAGMHEIEIINRMRMRRAWESILPPCDTPSNIKFRNQIIAALETDKWAFRDSEIQFIIDLRIKLAEQNRIIHEQKVKKKTTDRFQTLNQYITERREQETKKIKNKFQREVRKLSAKYSSIKKVRRNRGDIVKSNMNQNSNYSHFKPRYNCFEKLQKSFFKEHLEKPVHQKLCFWDNPPPPPHYTMPKMCSGKICLNVKKREERNLLWLTQNLDAINDMIQQSQTYSLLKRKEKPMTPTSRSSVTLKSESRVQGSIVSLVISQSSEDNFEEHEESLTQLLDYEEDLEAYREGKVNEILLAIEGQTIVKQLNYLNEKLSQLQKEKEAHAIALLAEKKRIEKEIARETRDQQELNRRREIDEIFRHLTKVNQESVELYLEDIFRDSAEWMETNEAEGYIENLADKIGEMEKYVKENEDKIDDDGIIAELVYNFVFPEVEKELEKEKVSLQNKSLVVAAHAAIHEEISNLSGSQLLSEDSILVDQSDVKISESNLDSKSSRSNPIKPKTLVVDQLATKGLAIIQLDTKSPSTIQPNTKVLSGQESLETIRSESEENSYLYIVENIFQHIEFTNDEYKKRMCQALKKLLQVADKRSCDRNLSSLQSSVMNQQNTVKLD